MNESDRKKLFKLRCMAKSGVRLHPDDQHFIDEMFKRFPAEYKAMNKEVFDKTKPFGA